jgi:hypothetical protein
MKLYLIAAICGAGLLLLATSCKKYEPQFEGAYTDAVTTKPVLPHSVALIINNDLYTMDAEGRSLKKLTNSGSINTRVVISPDYTKIAFRSNNDICTIDSSGNNFTVVGNSAYHASFDFHNNSTLLYAYNTTTKKVVALTGTLPTGLPQPKIINLFNGDAINVYITPENDLFYNKRDIPVGSSSYDYSLCYAQNGSSTITTTSNSGGYINMRVNVTGTTAILFPYDSYDDIEIITLKNRSFVESTRPSFLDNVRFVCPLAAADTYLVYVRETNYSSADWLQLYNTTSCKTGCTAYKQISGGLIFDAK